MNITLDATTIPLLLTGVIGVIGALVTGILSIISALRETRRLVVAGHVENTAQNQEIIDKTDHITELTNSNLTKVKADLAVANDRITTLQALVEKLLAELATLRATPQPGDRRGQPAKEPG